MKSIVVLLLTTTVLFTSSNYYGESTAPVILSGAIIKASHVEPVQKKYKRSQCPVCKGKGWYISGDGIEKVNCGYCEPDKKDGEILPEQQKSIQQKPRTIIHRK